jgi:hypothetical protein
MDGIRALYVNIDSRYHVGTSTDSMGQSKQVELLLRPTLIISQRPRFYV